jgi:hypothetical protein
MVWHGSGYPRLGVMLWNLPEAGWGLGVGTYLISRVGPMGRRRAVCWVSSTAALAAIGLGGMLHV